MVDLVEPRENIRGVLRRILALHAGAEAARGGSAADRLPETEGASPVVDADSLPKRDPWDVVQLARMPVRPHTLDYVGLVFDDFQELHGDRLFTEDAAIVGGLARLGELTVMAIGHQKGRTTAEMMERNFGMPNPEGYRKALRLMHYAVRFGLPIITFVDTPGAFPGLEAEERGQSVAIAESILQMSRLPVPIVTTVIGEGGSGGALAIAASDRVMILEGSYYSVISPEGCATILFKDALAAPRAAAALKMSAPSLLRLGIVDSVVLEPEAGAHTDQLTTAENLKTAIVTELRALLALSTDDLLAQRYERFRVFGRPGAQPVLPSEVTP